MKTVFGRADEVAHVWAGQSQSEGRCTNMFFHDNVICSYRETWPLGCIIPGKEIVILNSSAISHTTANHQRYVNDATSHMRQIHVPCDYVTQPKFSADCADRLLAEVTSNLQKALKARDGASDMARAQSEFANFEAYCDALKAPRKYKAVTFERLHREAWQCKTDAELATLYESRLLKWTAFEEGSGQRREARRTAQQARWAQENAEAQAVRAMREQQALESEAMRKEKAASAIPQWLAGGPDNGYLHYAEPVIRVSPEDPDVVESSHHAFAPLVDVVRAAKLYLAHDLASGTAIGAYTVKEMGLDGGVRIGCHTFTMGEVNRFLSVLKEQGLLTDCVTA